MSSTHRYAIEKIPPEQMLFLNRVANELETLKEFIVKKDIFEKIYELMDVVNFLQNYSSLSDAKTETREYKNEVEFLLLSPLNQIKSPKKDITSKLKVLMKKCFYKLCSGEATDMYRDHFIHQFATCLLGLIILMRILYAKEIFGKIASAVSKKILEPKFIDHWIVASLFHDIGIILSTSNSYCRELNNVKNLMKFMLEKNSPMYNIISRIEDMYENKLVEDKELHGLKSAYLLIKECPGIEKWRDILDAIIVHSLKLDNMHKNNSIAEIYNQIESKELAGLLVICDELQDWGRPQVAFVEKPSTFFYVLDVVYYPAKTLSLTMREPDKLLIRIIGSNKFDKVNELRKIAKWISDKCFKESLIDTKPYIEIKIF